MSSANSILPTSHFPLPTSRSALTLAEVLIAMGLLTLGLLGVASIFPVGGFYMQSGDIADRAGAVAEAALDDAMIRGYLRPENWVVIDISSLSATSFGHATQVEKLLPTRLATVPTGVKGDTLLIQRNRFVGGAFVIDPWGMAQALNETSPNAYNRFLATGTGIDSRAARRFPAMRGVNYRNGLWKPWTAGPINGAEVNQQMWPVRRVTTAVQNASSITNANFNRLTPVSIDVSVARDDLASQTPAALDDPAQSLWEYAGTAPLARQSRGEYSWVLSIAPSSAPARDGLTTTPDAYPYEVSAVVFHKRVVAPGNNAAMSAERLVNARVVSTSPGGGELLLERRPTTEDAITTSPFENLRVGQYVMLTGPHPLSTDAAPRLVLHWYRVLSIEDQGAANLPGVTQPLSRDRQVLVSLRGPDWPWTPAPTGLGNPTQLSNDLRVAILPGAVAVHTKTMRLESATEWSVR